MLLPRSRELYPLSFILLLSIFITGTLFLFQLSEAQAVLNADPCPEGYVLNEESNKCEIKASDPCPDGYVLNEESNKCEIKASDPCPDGYVLNEESNKCESVNSNT